MVNGKELVEIDEFIRRQRRKGMKTREVIRERVIVKKVVKKIPGKPGVRRSVLSKIGARTPSESFTPQIEVSREIVKNPQITRSDIDEKIRKRLFRR